jgi:hypothetical protein
MCEPGGAGPVWTRLGTNLPHGLVLDLRYNYTSNVLVAGILGRGAWKLIGFFTGGHGTWESAATATADESATATTPLALPADIPNVVPKSRASDGQAVAQPRQ